MATDAHYAAMYELWQRLEEDVPFDIALDLGRAESYPLRSHPWFLGVRIPMTKSDEHGMAPAEEAERLNVVENRVRDLVKERGGLYVGRLTGGSNRDLLFYLDAKPRGLEERLRMTVGMELLFISRPDPKWQGYERLMPTPREFRQIEDRHLINELISDDVDPDELHTLLHRVETSSAKGAEALLKLFQKLELDNCTQHGERPKIVVSGTHQTPLEVETIHRVAWILESRAPKARGVYLGWRVL